MQRRKSSISALSIALLIWQALTTLLPLPGHAHTADSVLGPILICTSEGVVRLDQPSEDESDTAHLDCLCCIAGGCSAKLVQLVWKARPYEPSAAGILAGAVSPPIRTSDLAHFAQPRAPPLMG